MNILVITQHYQPEPFRISDICKELVLRGHSVTVVTDVPNYPEGEIYDEYRRHKRRTEIIDGVAVHRVFTIARHKSVFWRVLNYYSYSLASKHHVRRQKGQFDVVFVNQLSPVMMADAGVAYHKKYGKRLVLYCLDLWPLSLLAGGVHETSAIYRYYHGVSARIYREADCILVTSQGFLDYFKTEFGLDGERVQYLPQYADITFAPAAAAQKKETVDLMFAGNIGAAQSVETILYAADRLRAQENLRWHILGDGSDLENCRALAERLKLTNVIFYGRRPQEQMPELFSLADAMLVTMTASPIGERTLPGKMQAYMAAGKPVIGAADGEIELVIRQAGNGFCGAAEDAQVLAENVLRFLQADAKALGENSLSYYQQHFSKEAFLERLEETLRDTAKV